MNLIDPPCPSITTLSTPGLAVPAATAHWTNSTGSARDTLFAPFSRMTCWPVNPFQTQLRKRMVLALRRMMPL
jgi:hypothetical protein